MYVCICNAITDKQIRQAAKRGVDSLPALQNELGVAAGCGSCMEVAEGILADSKVETRKTRPQVYRPAPFHAALA